MNIEELKKEAEAFQNQAKTYNRKGETAQAVAAYSEAEKRYAALGNERECTSCWSGMAKAYGKNKEFEAAVAAFQNAAQHAKLADWPEKELEIWYNLGLTLQQMGVKTGDIAETNQAIAAFQAALEIAERTADRDSAGVLLVSLGFACAWVKRTSEAIAYFEAAAPFALDKVDFDTAFSAFSSLGVLLSNNGRAADAIPYYLRALELAKTAQGDIVAVADTYANLGIAYEKAGQLDEAIEATDTYREILHVAGDVKATDATAMVKRLRNKARLEKENRR